MGRFRNVSHVIFDVDGLLLDTERISTEAIQRIASLFGKQYTWELKARCMGMKKEDSARSIIDALEMPLTVSEYISKINIHYQEMFPEAKLLPGAEKLVRHLHEKHIPMAIASGSSAKALELKTTNHKDFFSLFHHSVLGCDPAVKHGKPAPYVFLECAKRFEENVDPRDCLLFEDSSNGVEAALAANMQVVAVPDERLDTKVIAGATQILKSLEEFKPEDFGLPEY